MIPVAFLTQLWPGGKARFAAPFDEGMEKESTFAELFSHFLGRNEAALPEMEEESSDVPALELMDTIREWMPTLPVPENEAEETDWETTLLMLKEAVTEKEALADLRGVTEAFVAGDTSVETFLNEMVALLESKSTQGDEASLREALTALIPSLTALVAFATEKGGEPEQRSRQRPPYLPSWPQVADRNGAEPIRASQEWLQMQGRGQTPLPHVQQLGSHPSSSLPFFNETLAMQPLNEGQQLTIHLGEQKTDHARAVEFVKQFQQVLGKGVLRVNGDTQQQITIKLYPESLGRLDITISKDNGVLQARFLTTTGLARELVESQLPHLRQAFGQQQLPVERIVVEQMNTEQPEERKEENPSFAEDERDPHEGETEGENDNQSFAEWLQTLLNEEEEVI
ncbi:flagellar hook-length control protein FliK [Natribacillus halophilus]|uniref:Flagellar hook-length control protein FliK n=1 Tax=Natribacillus halophilus TaxID=549003 RepID=A0A1G8PPY2_9BACI|nr:flagellar hook-length control protein FliK [Natribacillus halophilus]SDI93930.1 Flagellar hook-length control protein FliK [Natribacillus halophilus]